MFKKKRNALIEEMRKIAERAAQRAVRDQEFKERVQANAKILQDMEERKLERKIAKGADAAIDAYLEQAAGSAREKLGAARVGGMELVGDAVSANPISASVAPSAFTAREVSILIDERIAAAFGREAAALEAIVAEKKRRRELDAEDATEPTTEVGK